MKPGPLFSNIEVVEQSYDEAKASYKGIAIKTFILLAISIAVAIFMAISLPQILNNNPSLLFVALGISSIVGFISVIVGRISLRAAKYACVIYAVCEGLFLGTLSALAEQILPGAAPLAVFGTLIIFAVVLTLFSTGILRVSKTFMKIVYAMTFGVIAIALFTTIYSLIAGGIENLGLVIGIQAFLIIYGAITLTLDFAEAQAMVDSGVQKEAEWSVSLGLMVSLIYIYVQLIRFIIIIAANRD